MRNQLYLCLLLAGVLIIAPGCYHAQVTTDKAPSSTVIENQWAPSFVFGLVPPPVVETAQQCPNGLSQVETRISFLNGLVAGLTFNLFTPMHIKVTCASSGSMSALTPPEIETDTLTFTASTDVEVAAALQQAAQQSLLEQRPVAVRLNR